MTIPHDGGGDGDGSSVAARELFRATEQHAKDMGVLLWSSSSTTPGTTAASDSQQGAAASGAAAAAAGVGTVARPLMLVVTADSAERVQNFVSQRIGR